ncbi:PspC domain-containing protein [Nonomuraea sp. NPDC050783]|uniref:PspC domain-containing protein n=1 Tax=Nonomuraea sp. NPDC050783 TaxID=3154634 RepID=UPI0034676E94
MTEAPPREPAAPPTVLRRSSEGRILMGVCSGLGRHTGIDPVVFRVAFAVLLLGSGVGLFLYIAAFLLMKEPTGSPGLIEQWTRRDFDAETVMALLTAVLGFGLGLNLATVWIDAGTLVVGVFLAVSLLAAHANGVDLLGLARSMPERLGRRARAERPAPSYTSPPPTPPVHPAEETWLHAVPTPVSEPVAGATVAGEPGAGEPVASEPIADEPVASEPIAGEPVASEPIAGEPVASEPGAGGPVAGATAIQPGLPGQPAPAPAAGPGEGSEAGPRPRVPDAVTAEHPVPPYQPLRPQPQPRTTVAYGEPFAPNGPYRPLDPARRSGGGYSPYDPALYGRPVPRRPQPERRPKSFIGSITILLAIIMGGIVVAVQSRSAAGVSPTVVGGAMLITIGAGLLVAAWWGRGAGLVAAGVTVALAVSAGFMLGGVPRNVGSSEWSPVTLADLGATPVYDVGVGDGRLDLSELELAPGTRATVEARVAVGTLEVIVPPSVRLEVHAANRVGDITIDQSIRGGVDIRLDRVLEPETRPKGAVPTLVLNLKGGLGDMEVRRGA